MIHSNEARYNVHEVSYKLFLILLSPLSCTCEKSISLQVKSELILWCFFFLVRSASRFRSLISMNHDPIILWRQSSVKITFFFSFTGVIILIIHNIVFTSKVHFLNGAFFSFFIYLLNSNIKAKSRDKKEKKGKKYKNT